MTRSPKICTEKVCLKERSSRLKASVMMFRKLHGAFGKRVRHRSCCYFGCILGCYSSDAFDQMFCGGNTAKELLEKEILSDFVRRAKIAFVVGLISKERI